MIRSAGIILVLILACSSCNENNRIRTQLKKVMKEDSRAWDRILTLQGTAVQLDKDNAGLMQEYCMQLVNAGYHSRALKECRILVSKENGKPQYADLYWGILAKNYLNPLSDPLFIKYYKEVNTREKMTFGLIIDSVNTINGLLSSFPASPEYYTARGKLFYMISENAAAEWDLNQGLRFNSDNPDALYNLAFAEFHKNNLARCRMHLERYERLVKTHSIKPYDGFPKFKYLVQQLSSIDEQLKAGNERNPLLLKRARLYMDAGEYRLSIPDLNEVMKIEQKNPNLFALRAYAHKQSGHDSAAVADLRKAEQLAGKKYPDLEKEIMRK
ncbi:MAG: hypothetical protein U0T82_09880 [Bacteroidales bacterium]